MTAKNGFNFWKFWVTELKSPYPFIDDPLQSRSVNEIYFPLFPWIKKLEQSFQSNIKFTDAIKM